MAGRLRAADIPYKANGLFHFFLVITLTTVPPDVSQTTSSALIWTHPSASHYAGNCWQCRTFNPIGYITWLLRAILFSIVPAPDLTTSPLQDLTLPLAAVPGDIPRCQDFVPGGTHPEVLTLLRRDPLVATLSFPCGAIPARVSSFLHSRTTSLSDWDWTPLWRWNALLISSNLIVSRCPCGASSTLCQQVLAFSYH